MSERPTIIPETTTPSDLAKMLGASPRRVKDKVRELGCYRKIGAKVIMLAEDVEIFMEATKPCRSNSTSAGKSGTTGAQLPEGDSEALRERLTRRKRRDSHQRSKKASGTVVSMDRGRG